jgi:hypothetical protein
MTWNTPAILSLAASATALFLSAPASAAPMAGSSIHSTTAASALLSGDRHDGTSPRRANGLGPILTLELDSTSSGARLHFVDDDDDGGRSRRSRGRRWSRDRGDDDD